MKIKLATGEFMRLDIEDAHLLGDYVWRSKNGYAMRGTRRDGKTVHYYLHRLIANAPPGLQVDHINGDTLDNRRANLRVCTKRQNAMNLRKPRDGKASAFKGVAKKGAKWQAQISVNNRNKYLGLFKTELGAARAYNEAAKQYYGEFARLNEVGDE